MVSIVVSEDMSGKRLDVGVLEQLPTLTRAGIKKLSDAGKISVNGKIAKPAHTLSTDDKIVVDYDVAKQQTIPTIDIPVLYEDDDCIVINKPIGVLSHSKGAYNPEATVATFFKSRVKDLDGERGGIVHRLDRVTSGLMIGAKTPEAMSWLQKQFSSRKVKKIYIAVIAGRLDPLHAIIDMPIERNPKAPATFRVGPNGKASITEYEVTGTSPHYSLVKLTPKTGRTHQLRVHLKQFGHPIVGDVLYGGEAAERLYLHAQELEITLPNRERKVFTADLPKQFQQKLEQDHA